MITEAIILAGGLGTRLREAVPDLPKCMAEVAGRPFISYVIDYLRMQGVQRFIFSLGYKAEVIENYLADRYTTLEYETVIEDEPLGTGGAIQAALQQSTTENVIITNGDTLFKVTVAELFAAHQTHEAACTLALKRMQHFDRYGSVLLDENNCVVRFEEKKFYEEGLINGGLYLLNKEFFLSKAFPQKFSFEKDFLESFASEGKFCGTVQDGYFIDIGIPSDYTQAQTDLKSSVLHLKEIDKSWTLFLDRDGVINEERLGLYVLNWSEFIFSKDVLEVWKILSEKFGRIIIATNQRGVSKKLMTEDDLTSIHQEMLKEVKEAGGHVDKIYYTTELDDKHPSRKPNPGMALQAMQDFPDIDLNKSIMVGNKLSDARFGKAAGMFTVFVATTNPEVPFPHPDIDLRFPSLAHFARAL